MGLPWAPNICQVLVSPLPTIHTCQPVLASRQADGGAGFTPPHILLPLQASDQWVGLADKDR